MHLTCCTASMLLSNFDLFEFVCLFDPCLFSFSFALSEGNINTKFERRFRWNLLGKKLQLQSRFFHDDWHFKEDANFDFHRIRNWFCQTLKLSQKHQGKRNCGPFLSAGVYLVKKVGNFSILSRFSLCHGKMQNARRKR